MTSQITIIGNLTAAPEGRTTTKGEAVANFTIADSRSWFDDQTGEWRQTDAIFWRVTAFGHWATKAVESLGKGTKVVVQGQPRADNWTDKEGNKRTETTVRADVIATVLTTKADTTPSA